MIGAGIVGVASAYELAVDGHAVTVFERRSSLAAEASFATTGITGPAFVPPWAGPAMSGRLLRELFARQGGMRIPGLPDTAHLRWLWRWSQSSEPSEAARLRTDLLALSNYSHRCTQALIERLKLVFERSAGLLILLRDAAAADAAQPHLALLRNLGIGFTELDATGCHAIEPGLNKQIALAGGIRLALGEAANCRQFAHLLRDESERLGVEFRFATAVRALGTSTLQQGTQLQIEQLALTTGFASSHAQTPVGTSTIGQLPTTTLRRGRAAARFLEPLSEEGFDAIVIAAGVDSTELMPSLGLKLPLQPVYGYSMTAPLRAPDRGPRAALIDEHHGVAISRLGQRVRIAGGVELGGSAQRQRRAPIELLFKLLHDWFPGAAHTAKPQVWKGARPMLPEGPPVIGPSPRPGVWLNVGHGASGWSMACGSARLLADQIAGRSTAIDATPHSAARYAAGASRT